MRGRRIHRHVHRQKTDDVPPAERAHDECAKPDLTAKSQRAHLTISTSHKKPHERNPCLEPVQYPAATNTRELKSDFTRPAPLTPPPPNRCCRDRTLFMKLDLPTLGKPVSRRVLVLGSRAGRRARCRRTSSRYERDAFCLLSSVHMRPSAARLSCLHR